MGIGGEKMKIKIGKYSFQTYPIKEKNIPKKWRVFTKYKIFRYTFAIWESW